MKKDKKSDSHNHSKNCEVCNKMTRKTQLETTDGKMYKLERHYGCNTWNVVYGIYCRVCKKVVYVGETERTAQERMKEHLDDIRLKRQKSVPEHFYQKGHTTDDVELMILERCTDSSKYYRKIRELRWIEQLQTEKPNGANVKTSLGVLWREYQ